jgi:smad nuclear-interacting protein 1
MPDNERERSRYDDRSRDREKYHDRSRDRDREYRRRDEDSRTHRRSYSRDHSPRRMKREDFSSPPRRRDSPPRRSKDRSLSPYSKRAQNTRSPRRHSPSPEAWGSHQHDVAYDKAHPPKEEPKTEKQKPNYGLSGLLAAATNTKNGIVLKYHEPPEARRAKGWRVYVFKDGKEVDVIELGGQSSYLIGRERTVVDIPVDHTSCSKQHAVIQFREVAVKDKHGDVRKKIKYFPFLERLTYLDRI